MSKKSSTFAPDLEKRKKVLNLRAARNAAKLNFFIIMSNSKNIAANQAANIQESAKGAKYQDRMHTNSVLLKCNLSQLFKRCASETTIPADLVKIAKESAPFASFRAHMVARHKLQAGAEYPKNGWSAWFALEWFEQQIKAAAADESNPAHKKAVAYLRKTRAELQDIAAKLM